MKGHIHSFHMMNRHLICYKRLQSYRVLKLLFIFPLVHVALFYLWRSHKVYMWYWHSWRYGSTICHLCLRKFCKVEGMETSDPGKFSFIIVVCH